MATRPAADKKTAANQGFDSARLTRIRDWMQRYVDQRKIPGGSVLIRRHGHEVCYAEAGLRSVEDGTPFQRDTIVRIYSMTKPIVTVALMDFVARGAVHLDLPLADLLPEFSKMEALVPGATRLDQTEPAAPIRLHHLLTHTSGMTYGFSEGLVPAEMVRRGLKFTPTNGNLADVTAQLATLPLVFQPGDHWEYSVSIDVIGRVLEVLAGKTLDQVLRDIVLDPLAMQDTGFAVKDADLGRFASLYTPLDGDPFGFGNAPSGDPLKLFDDAEGSPFRNTSLFGGGGGLVGTIDDYSRFCEMLRCRGVLDGRQVLAPRIVDYMMRNHLPGDIASMATAGLAELPFAGSGFGLGGAVILEPALTRMPGSVGDFSWGGIGSTYFWVDPVLDMSVVFFTQLSPSSIYPLRQELKALVHGALTD